MDQYDSVIWLYIRRIYACLMGAVKDTTGSTIAPFLIMVLLSSVLLILSFSEKNEPSIDL